MGCDIHVHTECKIQGVWRHWGAPSVDRWYELFEKMAGVRGDIKNAIAAPKGLPKDVTFETLFDYEWWGGGMHSESWLSLEEIRELYKWWETRQSGPIESQFEYLMGNSWIEPQEGIEDVRWVFWFDN